MKSSFATASSVHVTGHLIAQGHKVTMSVGMLRSGNMSGTVTYKSTAVDLVVVNGKAYELVTRAYFKLIQRSGHVPSSVCALMCGKYIAGPTSAFKSFSLPGMISSIEKKIPVPSSVPHLSVTTYQGQAADKLSGDGVMYVAERGPHYLLGMADPAKFGALTFSDWNAVPAVSAPPASKIYSAG
jgi:hypothetical protein